VLLPCFSHHSFSVPSLPYDLWISSAMSFSNKSSGFFHRPPLQKHWLLREFFLEILHKPVEVVL
jgi:hypothetical protein